MKSLFIEAEVYDDLAEAADWYEGQQRGLGDRCFVSMRPPLEEIVERPGSFPKIARTEVRWAMTRPFPYKAYFTVDAASVRVFAVMHAVRKPNRWRERGQSA